MREARKNPPTCDPIIFSEVFQTWIRVPFEQSGNTQGVDDDIAATLACSYPVEHTWPQGPFQIARQPVPVYLQVILRANGGGGDIRRQKHHNYLPHQSAEPQPLTTSRAQQDQRVGAPLDPTSFVRSRLYGLGPRAAAEPRVQKGREQHIFTFMHSSSASPSCCLAARSKLDRRLDRTLSPSEARPRSVSSSLSLATVRDLAF